MANASNENLYLIKDLKPGLKNINLVFIVLETGKSSLRGKQAHAAYMIAAILIFFKRQFVHKQFEAFVTTNNHR